MFERGFRLLLAAAAISLGTLQTSNLLAGPDDNAKAGTKKEKTAGVEKKEAPKKSQKRMGMGWRLRALERRLRIEEKRSKEQEKINEELRRRLGEKDSSDSGGDLEDEELTLDDLDAEVSEIKSAISQYIDLNIAFDFDYRDDDRTMDESFRQRRLYLFARKKIADFRVFGHIEFEEGAEFEAERSSNELEEAKGAIELERAWIQWEKYSWFCIRAGKWLIPSYFNINHFPQLHNTVDEPIFNRRILPFSQTGIMINGEYYLENLFGEDLTSIGFDYAIYASNGRTAAPAAVDDDHDKAVGGRLLLHLPRFEGITILNAGVHVYHEKSDLDSTDPTAKDQREKIRALEFQFEVAISADQILRYFGLNAEYQHSRVRVKGGADFYKEGYYIEPYAGFVLLDTSFLVYYRYEHSDLDSRTDLGQDLDEFRQIVGARIFLVNSRVQFKGEYRRDDFDEKGRAQVDSWVFTAIFVF
jgi:hypothetical protein